MSLALMGCPGRRRCRQLPSSAMATVLPQAGNAETHGLHQEAWGHGPAKEAAWRLLLGRPQSLTGLLGTLSTGQSLSEARDKRALRGTPGSACPQPEPNAAELPSCALSQRELHKDGGGGGGGEARKARAARAPKANSCATSCGTPSATPSATAPRPWRPRPSRGFRR